MRIEESGTHFVVRGEAQCDDCKGTGLYVGMAERNGAAVECWKCRGSGYVSVNLKFAKFTGRKKRKGVVRVFDSAHGYGLSAEDVMNKDGKLIRFSEAGCAYKDWLKGVKPVPIKDLHCPYQHTNQDLQLKDRHDLYKTRCNNGLSLGGRLADCKFRSAMATCWEIYDGKQ